MQVSAILLTGKRLFSPDMGESAYHRSSDFGPASLACVEVFGQSVLERTIARLHNAGVQNISVVAARGCVNFRETRKVAITLCDNSADGWAAVKRIVKKDAERGIGAVLVAELGAYVELDVAGAVRFHNASGQAITPIHDHDGPLSYWIVNPARILMANRDFPLPLDEYEMVNPPAPCLVDGYVNHLATPREFRQLVVDAFFGRCSITPPGRQLKPGIWVDEGARVHKTARLVGPAYIGRSVRVHAGAVITRCSSLERNCTVGEGSIVVDASILPHTLIGRGLDVSGAVVDGSDYCHLAHNLTLRILDPQLVSTTMPQRVQLPAYLPEYAEADRENRQMELEYSHYLSRAAGRLLEVFKGEV